MKEVVALKRSSKYRAANALGAQRLRFNNCSYPWPRVEVNI